MVTRPPLVHYRDINEYRRHYEQEYGCHGVVTADGIRVFFRKNRFDHAFYESSNRDGLKDRFAWRRAKRIDWIRATLESSEAEWRAGWNRQRRRSEHRSRVAILLDDFVVVIRLSLRDDVLRGDFVTAYVADNSINKIRNNPRWNRAACLRELRGKGGGR